MIWGWADRLHRSWTALQITDGDEVAQDRPLDRGGRMGTHRVTRKTIQARQPINQSIKRLYHDFLCNQSINHNSLYNNDHSHHFFLFNYFFLPDWFSFFGRGIYLYLFSCRKWKKHKRDFGKCVRSAICTTAFATSHRGRRATSSRLPSRLQPSVCPVHPRRSTDFTAPHRSGNAADFRGQDIDCGRNRSGNDGQTQQ